jgi:2-C-methyl-D-erythritol 4-phosphate cytidylyltransferase
MLQNVTKCYTILSDCCYSVMVTFALILPAAGKSHRYGGARSKLLEVLDGITVIALSLKPFLQRSDLACVVVPSADAGPIRSALGSVDERIEFCAGGDCRAASVYEALKRVPASIEWVAVHDGARPLVSGELIEATLAAAREHGAAVPALAAALTIKQATGPLPAKVERTLARTSLWTMQTPQVMRRADLLEAFEKCPLPLDQITDDVQLLELAGKEVWLVPGDERNLKITTAMDLRIAQLWLSGR